MKTQQKQTRQGILFALIAYFSWGIAPVYFKLIQQVPADEILAHRIIWSFFFMLILLTLGRRWTQVRQFLRGDRRLWLLAVTALLIGVNWLLFIWAVNNHHMLEASLGYFINPLVSVMLGMIFLRERLRRLQRLAAGLAVFGVFIQLRTLGSLPVVALGLAFSFGFYGLLRKKIACDAQIGMLIETLWLLPVAAVYLFFIADSPTSHLRANSWILNLLLAAAGIVTTVPLLSFTAAATRLRLSTLGFFQYISPSVTFLLAIFCYGEKVSRSLLLTFIFIWTALLLFTLDAFLTERSRRRTVRSETKHTD